MIEELRDKAVEVTGDNGFANSSTICIAVSKNNHLAENNVHCPKLFVFDTSVDVTDYKENGDLSSHIANFFDSNS